MTYTVDQLYRGEGLSSVRPMLAWTYDGERWHTGEVSESICGDPIQVYTVPVTGWQDRV
jgi:hypothetical protein